MCIWAEEIEVRGFDFLEVEPKEEWRNNNDKFVVIPCRLKVEMQRMLSSSGDATSRTIDIGNKFGNANGGSAIKNSGR